MKRFTARFTARELILLTFTITVSVVLLIVVGCASIGSLYYGRPIAAPGLAEHAENIISALIGLIAGSAGTAAALKPPMP